MIFFLLLLWPSIIILLRGSAREDASKCVSKLRNAKMLNLLKENQISYLEKIIAGKFPCLTT